MGKLEEVEAEKKVWESDDAWELRKAFMLAHFDDYPKIQLQCLSQLFINVTLLGCEYSESLMQKIKTMGYGISAASDRKKTGSYVKASTAKKREAVKTSDILGSGDQEETSDAKRSKGTPAPDDANDAFNERLVKLRQSLSLTPHHLTGEQMLKSATNGCLMKYFVKKTNQKIEITIDRFVAFRHTFSQFCVDPQDCAINALIESILSCQMAVNDDGDEIRFDGVPSDDCYAASMKRRLGKMKATLAGGAGNLKALTSALEAVNMSLVQNTKKLEGWSQQLDLVAADLLLDSRILSSTECTKPAMATIADQMAAKICQQIHRDQTNVVNAAKSHSSLEIQ